MSDVENSWPTYPTPSCEHLVALGLISSNWNTLERVLFQLVFSFLDAPRDTAKAVFHQLNSAGRIQVLRSLLERGNFNEELKARVLYFIAAFEICRENRNWLLHSFATSETTDTHLVLEKQRTKDAFTSTTLDLDLSTIRAVADDIHATLEFGGMIYIHLEASHAAHSFGNTPRPLPAEFPLPHKIGALAR